MELNDYVIRFTDSQRGSFTIKPWTLNGPSEPSACPASPGVPGVAPPVQPVPQPGQVAANTSLVLPGKGEFDYGEIINTNLVRMLENFANACEPAYAIPGQIWYKNDTKQLYVANNPASTSFSQRWGRVVISGYNNAPIDATNQRIVNVSDPVDVHDAVNKSFTDETYVARSGSKMTGFLELSADPVADLHAATKRYVDAKTGTITGNFVVKTGDTMQGDLNMANNAVTNVRDAIMDGDALNLRTAHNVFVPQTSPGPSGTIMTGVYTIVHDGSVAPAALTISGNHLQVTNGNVNITKGDLVLGLGNFSILSASVINMGSNRIRSVAQPVVDTDAATKGYVDSALLQAGVGGNSSGVKTIRHTFRTTPTNAGPTFFLPNILGFSFPLAQNKLSVYVMGVKQASSTRGASYISLLGCSTPQDDTTLLPNTAYKFKLKVDSSATTVVTVTTPNVAKVTVANLVDAIKTQIVPLYAGLRVDIVKPYPSYVVIRLMSSLQGDGSVASVTDIDTPYPQGDHSLVNVLTTSAYGVFDNSMSLGSTFGFYESESITNASTGFVNSFTITDSVPLGTTIEVEMLT